MTDDVASFLLRVAFGPDGSAKIAIAFDPRLDGERKRDAIANATAALCDAFYDGDPARMALMAAITLATTKQADLTDANHPPECGHDDCRRIWEERRAAHRPTVRVEPDRPPTGRR